MQEAVADRSVPPNLLLTGQGWFEPARARASALSTVEGWSWVSVIICLMFLACAWSFGKSTMGDTDSENAAAAVMIVFFVSNYLAWVVMYLLSSCYIWVFKVVLLPRDTESGCFININDGVEHEIYTVATVVAFITYIIQGCISRCQNDDDAEGCALIQMFLFLIFYVCVIIIFVLGVMSAFNFYGATGQIFPVVVSLVSLETALEGPLLLLLLFSCAAAQTVKAKILKV